ncbi:hypothetical protein ACLBX9_28675 [Methylobacterium sp. A49B]
MPHERNPFLSHLLDMDADISDVARWGELLFDLGASPNTIDPVVLHVIAGPLADLGKRLDVSWHEALRTAGCPS